MNEYRAEKRIDEETRRALERLNSALKNIEMAIGQIENLNSRGDVVVAVNTRSSTRAHALETQFSMRRTHWDAWNA